MSEIIEPILLDKTGRAMNATLKESAIIIADSISGKGSNEYVLYGFHVNANESDPYSAVTYLEDAKGMVPAKMNYANNLFSYGSWYDAFFMPRPCMLNFNGTVDYYLDENDYEKKDDGTMSALGDSTLGYGVKYPGNAMMEWGKYDQQIWTKVVPDADDPKSGSVYIANKKVDADYTAYPFINNQGELTDHFYTAIYNGSVSAYTDGTNTIRYRLRSIPRQIVMNSAGGNGTVSGTTYTTIPWDDESTGDAGGFALTQALHEINLALNNNPSLDKAISTSLDLVTDRPYVGWFTEVFADIQLINNLLVLVGKSLNTQEVFGNGNMNGNSVYGASLNNGVLYTGSSEYITGNPNYDTLNKSGLFWGTAGNANAVKVFGMENWWGNQFRRYAGHINKSNGTTQNHFVKSTFGSEDGTTAIGYNTNGTNYIDTGVEVPATGYIKAMKFLSIVTNTSGTFNINTFLPVETSSTNPATIFWCDYCYKNTSSGIRYSARGGSSYAGSTCGAFFVHLNNTSSNTSWAFGAALSYKPVV